MQYQFSKISIYIYILSSRPLNYQIRWSLGISDLLHFLLMFKKPLLTLITQYDPWFMYQTWNFRNNKMLEIDLKSNVDPFNFLKFLKSVFLYISARWANWRVWKFKFGIGTTQEQLVDFSVDFQNGWKNQQ